MRFDNEFAAIEEGAVEVDNNELHWNDSDGWMTVTNTLFTRLSRGYYL